MHQRPSLILLHGALGAAAQFAPLMALLEADFELHTLDFSGHGSAPEARGPLSISLFAEEVLAYMQAHGLEQSAVFGYSMGGYVALYLARHHPEKITALATLATKLHWDEATAAKEAGMLDAAKMEAKVPQLAQALAARHTGKDWKKLTAQTAQMLLDMGADSPLKADDLKAISLPVLLMLGDRDKMVGLDETVSAYKALPSGQMAVLPGTPHPFEQVDHELLSCLLRSFC